MIIGFENTILDLEPLDSILKDLLNEIKNEDFEFDFELPENLSSKEFDNSIFTTAKSPGFLIKLFSLSDISNVQNPKVTQLARRAIEFLFEKDIDMFKYIFKDL